MLEITHARVVRTLWAGIAFLREAERLAALEKEIFLLEAEPRAGIVQDGRAGVGSDAANRLA